MARIIIVLPSNRAYAGSLHVESDGGETVLGPFAVCGRAQAEEAARHGNPNRNPLLPYGDTPVGGYRVREVVASNGGTGYPAEAYGPSGIVILDATSGDAALAEANGRYHIFIQGGATGSNKRLRATNGCLRLFDRDQAKLVKLLAGRERVECVVQEGEPLIGRQTVDVDAAYAEGDPPPMHARRLTINARTARQLHDPNRRDFLLRAGLAAGAFAMGVDFVAGPGAVAPAMAYGPESGRSPASSDVSQDTGTAIAAKADQVGNDYKQRSVGYSEDDTTIDQKTGKPLNRAASYGGSTSDCSNFVWDVLHQSGVNVPYTTTKDIATSPNFDLISDNSQAQAGDVIVEAGHMGVYNGKKDADGYMMGWQMGTHGPAILHWGKQNNITGPISIYRPKP